MIEFLSVGEFLSEVQAESASEDGIDGKIVRAQVVKVRKNQVVETIWLRAGFTVMGELRQLNLECGVEPAPSGVLGGELVASGLMREIKEGVGELDLQLRPGVIGDG